MSPVLTASVPLRLRSKVVLPTPLRPSSATASPLVHREIDGLQHRAAAIASGQVAGLQQHRSMGMGDALDRRRRGLRAVPGGAEIGRDHVGVGCDLRRLAVGDHAALVQHRDAVGDRQHAVDIVLDQQHGVGLGELADQFGRR